MKVSLNEILEGVASIFNIPPQNVNITNDSHCIIQGSEATPLTINILHPLFLHLNSFQKLSFIGCYFEKKEDEIFLNFNIKKVHFANCTFLDCVRVRFFEGDVEFNNAHFYEDVYFFRSVFKGSFNLFHNTFHQGIFFIDCSFQPQLSTNQDKDSRTTVFLDNDFYGQFKIECSTFHNKVKFEELNFYDHILVNGQSIDYQSIMEGQPKIKDSANPTFLNGVEFRKIQVKKDMSFSHITFRGDATFVQMQIDGGLIFTENIYEKNIFLSNIQCDELCLLGTLFAENPDLRQLKKTKKFTLVSCIFCQPFSLPMIDPSSISLNLGNSTFKENVYLENKTFLNASFSQVKFEKSVDFSLSTFVENADFQKARFLESASFYGVKFENTPNFAQSSFQKELNLINTNLSFDYKNVKAKILQTYNSDNQDKKPLNFIINDFRDSFRIFKNTLSKEGNLLDASNYHRVELYCKEIELDSKLKDSWNWRDWIDKWQLRLYRHTSDHHTDLLRIISWVLITIGGFGVLFFLTKYYQDISILSRLSPYGIALSLAGIVSLGIFWTMGYVQKLFFFAGAGLISTLWIACYKPTLIFGVMNLVDKSPRSGFENFLLVLYTLVMILLLFSLQKTARKNSIVLN